MIVRPPRALLHLVASAALIGLSTATLVACGGGGSSSADGAGDVERADASTAKTALYFTDDFSATHDAVWITVQRVTAVSAGGETELVAFSPAKPLNLPELKQAGALVANTAVPAGATHVRVYVGSSAQLQQLDGSVRTVRLAAPGGYLEFRLEQWAATSGVLALDFDLPNFKLEGDTLTAATRIASANDFAGWNQRYAEAKGTVLSASSTALTVQTQHHGVVTFTLDANTSYFSASRGRAWTASPGDRVEVRAGVVGLNASATQHLATFVKDESDNAGAALRKVEGTVSAIAGTTLTLNVRESQVAGLAGVVQIDVGTARFTRGTAAALVPGSRVEAYVSASGATWVANAVELEGASRVDDSAPGGNATARNRHDYAEVKGRVTSLDANGSIVLNVLKSENLAGATLGSSLSVNLTGAYFKKGAAGCVAVGAPIEVKGSVSATGAFQPIQVELESGCALSSPLPSGSAVSPAPTSTRSDTGALAVGAFIETKGAVTGVRPGEFDIRVYKLEYAGVALNQLTVKHGSGTAFRNLAASQIAAGQFLEIKGTWDGQSLVASKVEVE